MKRIKLFSKNRIFAVILLVSMLGAMLSSCSGGTAAGVRKKTGVVSRNRISSETVSDLHFSNAENSFIDSGISSGFIELWIDESTCSFGIYDNSAAKLWTALPLKTDIVSLSGDAGQPSMVSLNINGGTDIYLLNSQDNSLAFGKASAKEVENGYLFSYDLFPNKETAEKTGFDKNDIGFNVEITVTLKDGSMSVACSWKNITGNPDACIESLQLLNYFGAYNATDEGDFLFVPDGCGAKINTAVYDESFEPLSFAVYGSDLSNPVECDGNAVLPAFGIKRGEAAFASLIEYGDAVSFINAEKATDSASVNRVYPEFNVTPVRYEESDLYISKYASIDHINMCYRFLSGVNATYAGMASAVREQLIRNGVLSTQTAPSADFLPMFLTLTGVAKQSFGFLSYYTVLTDFEQATDMLIRMKNKGISNVNVRYSAVKSGGPDSGDAKDASLLRRLGGKNGLNELSSYMSKQNMVLYTDIDLLTSADGFSGSGSVDIKGNETVYKPVNEIADSMGAVLKDRTLRKLSDIKSTVSSVLLKSSDNGITGLCLNDTGSILYSDFSAGGALRQEAADTIAGTVSPLSTEHDIMTVTGNFHMLKNIDSIINIPLSTTVAKSGAYTPVPFVQIILHGLADYAGDPINTQSNENETRLRCIEYGACPHYKWNYTPISKNSESDVYYYDNTINSAAEFYSRANTALNDLRDARMTDHYEVADGIFCTEYDTGAMIYVNYTDKNYAIRGLTVEAGDFLRIG